MIVEIYNVHNYHIEGEIVMRKLNKKYRWQFKAALPPVIAVLATFGFDDYFYGI